MWKRLMLYLEQRRCKADWDSATFIDTERLSKPDREFYLQMMMEQKDSVLKSVEEINKDKELPCMELVSI